MLLWQTKSIVIQIKKEKAFPYWKTSFSDSIFNAHKDFEPLFHRIVSVSDNLSEIKVELGAARHYNYNFLGFLFHKSLPACVINPLHTGLYGKSLSLRKAKADKVDFRTIATMMMSDRNLKSFSDISYHNEELKSLTRYRFDKVKIRAKLKLPFEKPPEPPLFSASFRWPTIKVLIIIFYP